MLDYCLTLGHAMKTCGGLEIGLRPFLISAMDKYEVSFTLLPLYSEEGAPLE
jgi:hypothetical protein